MGFSHNPLSLVTSLFIINSWRRAEPEAGDVFLSIVQSHVLLALCHFPKDFLLLRLFCTMLPNSQESCLFVRCLSGFPWGWCNGRRPHLQLRRDPQGSSPILTWISWCVCSFKQGVRSRLVLRNATLLSSRAVKEFSGLQSS